MILDSNITQSNTKKNQNFIRRIILLLIIIILSLSILLFNLYTLQIIKFNFYEKKSKKNYIKLLPLVPMRGLIYDRNGILLAMNKTFYKLAFLPFQNKDIVKKIRTIRSIIHISKKNVKLFLKALQKDTVHPIIMKVDLNDVEVAKFFLNKYRLPGFFLVTYQKRFYPYSAICAHFIGYISRISIEDLRSLIKQKKRKNYIHSKNIGKSGVEKYYENVLHGITGYKKIEIDNRRHIIKQISQKNAYAGYDIFLSIDIKLQKYVSSLIPQNIRSALIVLNPKDGSILAMVSTPSFNPNLFIRRMTHKVFNHLIHDKNKPLINRAIQGIYPPASTVKPYISIAALQLGLIDEKTIIFDPGWWEIPKCHKRYKDWKKTGHGYLDLIKSLEESADTFFYQIAFNMGINKIHHWMKKFGYGELTKVDLANEKLGNLPTKKWKLNNKQDTWYTGDTISVGIGQSYWYTTPIQMSKALIILINNGIVKQPHILKQIKINDKYYPFKSKHYASIRNISNQYWKLVKRGMYGVANHNNGTAYKSLSFAKYIIAAKSGTAQVFNLNNIKKYNINVIKDSLRDHKLMIAYTPYKNPQIAIVIIIENNKDLVIGDIMRKIFDYIFAHNKDFLIK
ncbi:penicillin-binding protein 2 [Enterobacteriaceae endosymbiont of Plateumaris consimilis]|uniref:penicillin-binding protein 2 n=1 Tax=Enterobacteriaceae endosymbiont of Plateumaris consimilis TaxID=2675794 RepID=UPI0014492A8C|nr:penicillin-binding protein 2 [Enterobacteriaceae endosymbiont of Plateumaris consimilis]QJC28702.1 penicillin-binding protein 2 [Enterobacteriaceae endosymbiont of Plateumaris consimilis]